MISTLLRVVTAIVIAGLLATAVFYHWQSDRKDLKIISLNATNATQQAANESLQRTVKQMVVFREVDQAAFTKLLDNQATVIRQSAAVNAAIDKLRETDAQVDKYLREPVPVPLRNIINGLRDKANGANCSNKDDHCKTAAAHN